MNRKHKTFFTFTRPELSPGLNERCPKDSFYTPFDYAQGNTMRYTPCTLPHVAITLIITNYFTVNQLFMNKVYKIHRNTCVN
jgi:hypothetical protein